MNFLLSWFGVVRSMCFKLAQNPIFFKKIKIKILKYENHAWHIYRGRMAKLHGIKWRKEIWLAGASYKKSWSYNCLVKPYRGTHLLHQLFSAFHKRKRKRKEKKRKEKKKGKERKGKVGGWRNQVDLILHEAKQTPRWGREPNR